jgi:hypothetical protein
MENIKKHACPALDYSIVMGAKGWKDAKVPKNFESGTVCGFCGKDVSASSEPITKEEFAILEGKNQ